MKRRKPSGTQVVQAAITILARMVWFVVVGLFHLTTGLLGWTRGTVTFRPRTKPPCRIAAPRETFWNDWDSSRRSD
jgi:hypothetical protein